MSYEVAAAAQGGKMDDITVLVARVGEEEVKVPRPPPPAPEVEDLAVAPVAAEQHSDAGAPPA